MLFQGNQQLQILSLSLKNPNPYSPKLNLLIPSSLSLKRTTSKALFPMFGVREMIFLTLSGRFRHVYYYKCHVVSKIINKEKKVLYHFSY